MSEKEINCAFRGGSTCQLMDFPCYSKKDCPLWRIVKAVEEDGEEGEKLSNVRGHLREVINRGNLSEGYRNYLKHVDDVIEEVVEDG